MTTGYISEGRHVQVLTFQNEDGGIDVFRYVDGLQVASNKMRVSERNYHREMRNTLRLNLVEMLDGVCTEIPEYNY